MIANYLRPLGLICMLYLLQSNFSILHAQQANALVKEFYTKDYLEDVYTKDPNRIAYLNYFSTSSYYFKEVAEKEGEKYPKLSTVSISPKAPKEVKIPKISEKNFNPFFYNFKRNKTLETVYRLDDSNQLIVFLSIDEFTAAFNKASNK